MTICAAALAAKSRAIVCVADKALSYGDYITWESDSTKIIPLSHPGCLAMFSGEEEGISRVISALSAKENLGATASEIAKTCEGEYKTCVQELVDHRFLFPRLLTRDQYQRAVSAKQSNPIIESLSAEIKAFNIACDLLICGFDSQSRPFILYQSNPSGTVSDLTMTGFGAIGSGYSYTLARLLFLTHKKEDDLDKVLYDTYDAKFSAEMSPSVGTDWDAVVIHLDQDATPHITPVAEEINELIESVWFHKMALSPYEKPKDSDPDPPPKNWKAKIKKYVEGIIPPAEKSSKSGA
jgi:hypothetical protein